MTRAGLTDDSRAEAIRQLKRVVNAVEEELATLPTLAEFLDVLSASVPSNSPIANLVDLPMRIRADVRGGRTVVFPKDSRTATLNDTPFVEAAELLALLSSNCTPDLDGSACLDEIAAGLLDVLQHSDVRFKELGSEQLNGLAIEKVKRRKRAERGEVVAIPRRDGKYQLAIVVDRNRFGLALGILGVFAFPRLPTGLDTSSKYLTIYTDEESIKAGAWPILGRNEYLLSFFPSEPEIYHAPDPLWGDLDLGEYGAAETSSGSLRHITRREAEDVGLLNGTYQQIYASEELPLKN